MKISQWREGSGGKGGPFASIVHFLANTHLQHAFYVARLVMNM